MNDYSDWSIEELQIEEAQLAEELWDIEQRLNEVSEELSTREDYE